MADWKCPKLGIKLFLPILVLASIFSLTFGQAKVSAATHLVSGTVTNAATTTPLSGVVVQAYNPGTNTLRYSVTTGVGGAYSVMVEAGTYDFRFAPPSATGLNSPVERNVVVEGNVTLHKQISSAKHIFSGVLTDQNGTALSNMSVTLRDFYGYSVSGTTLSGGGFNLNVQPGIYSLRVNGFITGLGSYTLEQPFLTPTIDVTGGSLSQNLQLKLATVNYTAYNAQGYKEGGARVNNHMDGTFFSGVSLYPGDPGYAITYNTTISAGSQSNFKSVVGSTYPANTLCVRNVSNQLIGCRAAPLDIPSLGSYSIDLPQTPPAPYTFSGTITASDGTSLPMSTSIQLRDAFGNVVSGNIVAGGNFSLSVQPGMYSLRISTSITGLGGLILEQNITTPTIDLTGGNVARNLQIQLSTVNYKIYNSQGYPAPAGYVSHRVFSTFLPVSLYPGDSGYTTTFNITTRANGQGEGNFKSIIGVTYDGSTNNNFICGQDGVAQFIGCVSTPLTITNAVHNINVPKAQDPVRTFSGALTGNGGVALSNFTVMLRDAFDNVVSGTTDASGNFSLAVQPGIYALEVNGSTNIFRVVVNLKQNSATPTINLTGGNVVQNLQIEFGKIDYTTYNAEGYVQPSALVVNRFVDTSTVFPVSLYPGSPGFRVTINGFNTTANAQGVGSFYSVVGVTYPGSVGQVGDNYICDRIPNGGLIGCVSTPFTVTSGTNYLDIPKTPLAPVTFSGVLSTSDGSLITNATVTLRDAASNIRSAPVNASGFFSVSVQPGMYALSVGGTITGVGAFGLAQDYTNPTLNLAAGSVVQNLQIEVATIDYTTNDPTTGMPRTLRVYAFTNGGLSQTVSLYPGDPSYVVSVNSSSVQNMISDSQGKGNFKSIVGATYGTASNNGICEYFSSTLIACITSPYTVVSGFNNLVIPQTPTTSLPAPTGLTAVSPTTLPVLSWQAVSGAYQYRVYRDGVMVGATFSTSFGNANLPAGIYSYYVTAVAGNGGESAPSNVISVTVEAVPPILGTPSLAPSEIVVGQGTNLNVNVSGNMSGFLGGEYFIGTDPGEGNGTSMSLNGNTLNATLNGLLPGNYTVNVRARNGAGWSNIVSAIVKVATVAPANLSGESPTHSVVIAWDGVEYASGYEVYRNGGKIATVLTTTYTDLTAPIGTNTYFVKALNPEGHPSAQSNVIDVTYSGPLHTVTGQVIFDGVAAPGVLVDLNQVTGPSDFDETDGTGTYTIPNMEDGNYSVTVSNPANGTSVISVGAPNYFELTSGFPFVVVNGAGVTQNLSFDTSAVMITVKNGQGLLMNGSKVTIVNTTDGLVFTTDGHVFNLAEADLRNSGSTGPGGTLVMYVFPGVTYQICASFPQTYGSSQPYCTPVGITVNGDMSYEFVLPASYSLSGHISFGGANVAHNGAKVIVKSADNNINYFVLSDANGDYVIDYLPHGVYDLEFVNNGSGAGGYIPQSWHFVKDAAIDVNGANVIQNLEFATNLVTTTVLNGVGDLVNGAIATLKSKSSNPVTTLDNSLTFDFASGTTVAYGTTLGGQTVLGVFSGQSYEACAIVSTGTYCNPTYVFVDTPKSVLVVAANTHVVSGTVSVNGNPIAQGTTVALTDKYTESDTTAANGTYAIANLVNGNYNVTVNYSGPTGSSVTTGLPDGFSLTSSQRYVTVNDTNAAFDVDFVGTYPLVVNVYDGSNNLIAGSQILVTGSGSILTSDGLMLFTLGSLQSKATSVIDGSPVLYLFAGVTYSVCAVVNGGTHCANYTLMPTANNLVEIRVASPANLLLAPITPYPQNPVLTWSVAPAAVSYNIYRDDIETPIASVAATSFTDTTATEGPYTYYVQAVYPGGNLSELSPSKSTVVDRTAPVLVSVSWSNNPSLFGSTIPVVTAALTDNLTDIVSGEYFVGEIDPGIGQGIAMGAPDMTITAQFGFLGYPPGTYLITMRGRDAAGIWSNTATTTLVVEHPAPTNLTAESITYVPPTISWSTVEGSQSYTIYRNGIDVASRLTNSFTDEGAVAGTNVYTVVAISLLGIQSAHSEPLSLVYDPFPPTMEVVYQPEPSNGWNNSPVTVSFICTSVYGIVICPEPVTVSLDGVDQPITVTATDVLGGSTTITAYVDLDQLAPSLGQPTLSENLLHPGQTTVLTVSATDGLSGVAGGEYFIGTDPGVGSGSSMQWDGTSLSAGFGPELAPGVYVVSVRVVDVAGNWSGVANAVLTVVLNAPANLAAGSPTQAPALTWTGSEGAVSYNIYRDDSLVGNVSGINFTDTNAADGVHSYYITAVDLNGNESQASNTISVLVNTVPPTTTATLSPNPYVQDGTYPDPVTVTLTTNAVSGLSVVATYYTVDGGTQQTYTTPFVVSGSGSHAITYWSVDNAGVVEAAKTLIFAVHANLPAMINPLTNATVNEGSSYTANGSFNDYDSSSWTATVDYGDGAGTQPLTLSDTNFLLSHVYADNGTYTVTVTITDGQGAASTVAATITVNNVAPAAGDITGIPVDPIQLGASGFASVNGSIAFTDPGILDTHTAMWDWGDGTTSAGVVTENNGAGTVTGSHNYTSPGIYIVTVTVTDNDGLSVIQHFYYVTVYDTGSMLTAGVRFDSPTGAFVANPSLSGSVRFSVHVKYNDSGVLTGSVSMSFAAGSFNFASTGFVVLVCTESGKATLMGSGTVNGVGGYTFLVTGVDHRELNGNTIRFQIKDSDDNIVYDTQPGADMTADPTTEVAAGTVIVK